MSKPFMKKLNPFKPTDIGGCQLWLDGADPAGTGTPPSNGATVSTWVDKATAKNATATGTSTYLTGGGINFTGSSYFLNQTFSQNISQRSIFIVFQETTNSQFAGVLTIIPTPNSGNDQSSTNGLSSETTSNTLFFVGNSTGYQSQIGSGNPLPKGIYYDSMNGTAGSGYFNGTNATNVTASYTAGTCSGYGLGGRWQGGSMSALYRLNGVIYEILFFNTTLSTRNRQQVEGYLAQKWGLEANLPAGSPGRTQVIYPHTLRLNSLTTGQPTRLPLIRQRAILNYIGFTITGSTAASATNYQIPITVYRSIGTNTGSSVYLGTDIYSDYSNLYFLASNQATILTFYIESGTQTSASARIWVSVPSIPASPSTTKVYIYWNMSGTYTSPSSGTSTFPSLFDDFNGTAGSAPNASKWSVQLKGTSTSSSVQLNGSGEVILTPTENSISSASLLSLNTIPANGFSIYIRRKYTTGNYPDTSFATTNTLVDSDYSLTSSWWHTTLGGGYVLFYQSPSNIVVRRQPTYTGSTQSATDIITPTISTSINTYEIVEIQYSTAGIINFIWNGVNKGTTTDTTFLSGGKYVLISQGNYTGIFNNVETVDYVFVRSYLNPEPSVTAWGSINTP